MKPIPPQHVYAIAAPGTGLVKIGRSRYPEKRIEQLRAFSPVPLKLLGIAEYASGGREADLHDFLDSRRHHNEWFELSDSEALEILEGGRPDPPPLCRLMRENGVVALDLACALSVSEYTVRQWERGVRPMGVPNLRRLADYFGVTTDEVLGRKPKVTA